VRNIENSRGVIVRINDRGPLKTERIIDLSFAAAKKIRMLDRGVARVRLEIIDEKTGLASWYGKRYHGKKTASGELFDMYQLTAAHKTLPFGTMVRVTNVENGKDVTLRINDRVPSSHKTLINVSRQAADKLDMLKSGTARVIVEVTKPENASKN
jgi:rare lipoprotein A